MTATAGLAVIAARINRTPLTSFGLCCCGMYAAYGARLGQFLVRRHREESYAPKFLEIQFKSDMMGLGPKLGIVAAVSCAQALYALPLAVATSPAAVRAQGARRTVGWAGVAVAAVGLLCEHFADEHKLAARRAAPRAPVMDGPYRYCRHPNYTGELVFHCGISMMGAAGTPVQVALCVLPTLVMGFTLQNSARRSDREADYRHAEVKDYQDWSRRTPVLLPALLKSEHGNGVKQKL